MLNPEQDHIIALLIHVEGLVQGVGFRPFIYRLAKQYHLNGWVVNRTDGVTLKIEGQAKHMPFFVEDLRYKAPVVAQIEEISIDQDIPEGITGFQILASQDLTGETSEISPDIAVCPDCLYDMSHQPHRIAYPFINCTNCGPRFSIIRDFPYDRKNTTMATFDMCPVCNAEYTDINDRRFHAQPVACNHCGPAYSMTVGSEIVTGLPEIMDRIISLVRSGGILGLKGIGGYHLACDALNEEAVNRLRHLKRREGKPFAVMFKDLDSLKQYAEVSGTEEAALLSWHRPIVILKTIQPLAPGITLGLDTLGAFLPYMPLHHMIFDRLGLPAVVLTSGNLADEPIIIDNPTALHTLASLTDAVITYDRDIFNRVDDSVVRVIGAKERISRRSRGYVPVPVKLGFDVDGILAAGAELSNCFCLGKGNRAYLSQHIGDLKNLETFTFFEETLGRFKHLFRIEPHTVAADMHPDYLSTRFAQKLGIKRIEVQHHHAHIASCMAENGVDEQVIGLAFDGTGYGSDGNIWGSEFLVCDLKDFIRMGHFEYMPMPGGDKAATEPWRMGLSLLYQAFGQDILGLDLPVIQQTDPAIIRMIITAIEKSIHCQLSSGMGRLFDATAAISGICLHARFHAEAPMRLESNVISGIHGHYDFTISETVSVLPAVRQICADISSGVAPGIVATKFHNTIAEASFRMAQKIRDEKGIQKIVLSGGTFQNKYLAELLENKLVKDNFTVYTHARVPCNDGGIALGQLVIAARRK
ncbi:MAG: carbamoyltransferase HypF [Bacteroidales bacterium]|nr:carbamoyltransferase HypF [Bacteroidales bacterium]